MNNLQEQLIKISIETSCFETKRDYVSLSNIVKPVDMLIYDYQNGYEATQEGHLKCRMGYIMEQALMERLLQIDGISKSKELIYESSNGLIKGHTDFMYYDMPGDCKSFLLDEWLPDEKKIPKKIYWQMNAYMLTSKQRLSYVVCESRESGMIKVIEVRKNYAICEAIEEKCNEIIKLLKHTT